MTFDSSKILSQVAAAYPGLTTEFSKEVEIGGDICCLWHRKGVSGHKGNFGLMGECLDCMAEIEKGRCTIDVRNFDMDIYWPVRNFWLKVDRKTPEECWPWMGATKKNNTETSAYMPSPFHKGGDQSAARVAFWTARGYVGKHRIKHKKGCDILCCNPLHLRLSQLVSISDPTEIKEIQLNYGHLKALSENKPSSAE